jgi:hypothetical protein
VRKILAVAQCHDFAFRLSPELQEVIAAAEREMNWEPGRRTLGIHLRRGDVARDRKSPGLEEFLRQADLICRRYDIDTIYLSTESEVEIARAKALRPQYQFLHLRYDRAIFPTRSETDVFIETRAMEDPSVIEPIVESALADLYFLKHSDAFVGAFNSEFTMLAWLLCIGDKGRIMPYVNMTPRRKLHVHAKALIYRDLHWALKFRRSRLLKLRLQIASETVRGQPLQDWPSLLRRRWNRRGNASRLS